MELSQKYYKYFMKNIPIPSEKLYRAMLIKKVELLTKRMRWEAHLCASSGKGLSSPLIFKGNLLCNSLHSDYIDLIVYR